jgi:hypothetical protein
MKFVKKGAKVLRDYLWVEGAKKKKKSDASETR